MGKWKRRSLGGRSGREWEQRRYMICRAEFRPWNTKNTNDWINKLRACYSVATLWNWLLIKWAKFNHMVCVTDRIVAPQRWPCPNPPCECVTLYDKKYFCISDWSLKTRWDGYPGLSRWSTVITEWRAGVRVREEDWSQKWSVMQEEARKGLRMQVPPETEKSRR